MQEGGALLPAIQIPAPFGGDEPSLVTDLTGDGCPDVVRFSERSFVFSVLLGACPGHDTDGDGQADPDDPCPFVVQTGDGKGCGCAEVDGALSSLRSQWRG